uniref:Phytanoyl-CoA dioxygenase n=1 Tax=uncultured bacterium esnapd2 TaxID=1366601 RepID=S5UAL3_9BACT|nr:phytanoyl-CoA dioxygenase [uncultured bacterium esnapd2]
MILTEDQITGYRENGYLVVDRLFNTEEVDALRDAFARDGEIPGDQRIAENDGEDVRAIYASHLRQPEFARLVRSPRLLGPVRQLLTDKVYVYQFKINAKPAFVGGGWAWHQDFTAWRIADALPEPKLVNVGLFLDDVTEFNGPLMFVPGSHRHGLIRSDRGGTMKSMQHLDPDDIQLTTTEMAGLVRRCGMDSPKGLAGSVIFFDPEIVHGSATNMSPFSRRLLLVTYNDSTNAPLGTPREWYLVEQDTTALEIVDEPLLALR